MNFYHKVKLTLFTTNLVGILGLTFYFSWWGLATALVVWTVFNTGVSAGFHRLFSHRSYETNKFWWWFLLLAGTLASIGSSISWVGQHRQHHAKSDVEGSDPYYPHGGIIKAWVLGPWASVILPLTVKDLIRDKAHKWLHDNYFRLVVGYVVVLALINPELVIWAWALPGAIAFFSLQMTGVFGHMIGHQKWDTGDKSMDCHWLNIFTFGESYQNTHHYRPKQIIMGKYDFAGYLVKYIFQKKEAV